MKLFIERFRKLKISHNKTDLYALLQNTYHQHTLKMNFMNLIRLGLLAFTATLAFQLSAQPIAQDKLQQTEDSLRAIVYDHQLPGMAVAIVSWDSVVWQQGFGYADVEAMKPVTAQTMFRIGSVTKSFVALGILRLVEEGKLDLNDKVAELAPEVNIDNPWSATDPVRLVHLLEHTAALLGWDQETNIQSRLRHCGLYPGKIRGYALRTVYPEGNPGADGYGKYRFS